MMTIAALNFPFRSLGRRGCATLAWFWHSGAGPSALDCVQHPDRLQYPMTSRALRLVRSAQISAW
jgi:hypothetical protein